MKKNISEKVEEVVKKYQPDSKIDAFIKASKEYDKLIQDGLTVRRGYNIMTTQEIYDQALGCIYSQPLSNLH